MVELIPKIIIFPFNWLEPFHNEAINVPTHTFSFLIFLNLPRLHYSWNFNPVKSTLSDLHNWSITKSELSTVSVLYVV